MEYEPDGDMDHKPVAEGVTDDRGEPVEGRPGRHGLVLLLFRSLPRCREDGKRPRAATPSHCRGDSRALPAP